MDPAAASTPDDAFKILDALQAQRIVFAGQLAKLPAEVRVITGPIAEGLWRAFFCRQWAVIVGEDLRTAPNEVIGSLADSIEALTPHFESVQTASNLAGPIIAATPGSARRASRGMGHSSCTPIRRPGSQRRWCDRRERTPCSMASRISTGHAGSNCRSAINARRVDGRGVEGRHTCEAG